MYDDIDLSGGPFDFDSGGPFFAQHPEAMYVDDDMYMDDMYSVDDRVPMEMDELTNGGEDADSVAYYERISLSDLFDQCVFPTLSQAFLTISPIVAMCVICRIGCLFCRSGWYYCRVICIHISRYVTCDISAFLSV